MKLGQLYKGMINDNPTHQKTVIIETCILMLKPSIGSQTKLNFVGDFNTKEFLHLIVVMILRGGGGGLHANMYYQVIVNPSVGGGL